MANSIHDLDNEEGTTWTHKPINRRSFGRDLLWWVAQELASMLELTFEAEHIRESAEEAVTALELTEEFFAERGEPRPRALVHTLILVHRADAGLDPRGR